MKIDEETFGTNDAVRMMFKIASDNNLSSEKRMIKSKLTSQSDKQTLSVCSCIKISSIVENF